VSDHRLDNRATGVPSPAQAKDLFSGLCVQSSSEAYPVGTRSPFPAVKRGRALTLTTHLLVQRSRKVRAILLSPLSPAWRQRDSSFMDTIINNVSNKNFLPHFLAIARIV